MDEMINIARGEYPDFRLTYNKHHVAAGTQKRDFLWLDSRKRTGYCHFNMKVGKENIEKSKGNFEEAGISFNLRKDDGLSVSIQTKELQENKHVARNIIKLSIASFS